jgi:hypothetical protein
MPTEQASARTYKHGGRRLRSTGQVGKQNVQKFSCASERNPSYQSMFFFSFSVASKISLHLIGHSIMMVPVRLCWEYPFIFCLTCWHGYCNQELICNVNDCSIHVMVCLTCRHGYCNPNIICNVNDCSIHFLSLFIFYLFSKYSYFILKFYI